MHKYNNNIADRCTDITEIYRLPTAACRTWDRPLIVLHEHKVPKTWAMLLREKMCLKHVPYNDSDHSSCGKYYWWRLYQVNKYLQIWFLLQDNKSPVSNIFFLLSNRPNNVTFISGISYITFAKVFAPIYWMSRRYSFWKAELDFTEYM